MPSEGPRITSLGVRHVSGSSGGSALPSCSSQRFMVIIITGILLPQSSVP